LGMDYKRELRGLRDGRWRQEEWRKMEGVIVRMSRSGKDMNERNGDVKSGLVEIAHEENGMGAWSIAFTCRKAPSRRVIPCLQVTP